MKEVRVTIPESLAAKVDMLLQIEGRDIDDLLYELLLAYMEQFVKSMSEKRSKEIVPQKVKEAARVEINSQMIETSYEIAKKVYEGKLTCAEGKQEVHKLSGMNAGSAQDFIVDFLAMMNGEEYKRTMSTDATEYFLRGIYADYGEGKFKTAVEATRKHLDYYASVSLTTSPKRRQLLLQLEQELLS